VLVLACASQESELPPMPASSSMSSSQGVPVISSLVSLVVFTGLASMSLAIYLLPVLIGWSRGAPDIGAIAVIDILLGWTLLGWVVALAMAFRSVTPPGPPPRHLPPPAAGASWAGPAGPPASRPGSPPPLVLPPRPASDQEDVGHGR
jgi:hypothetical protein